MNIKILGTGCKNCVALENNARAAAQELEVEATFEKVQDISKIIDYGVMRTPALVVDDVVVSAGKIPSVEELKQLLAK